MEDSLDLWEEIGSLDPEESVQVLTRLYTAYDDLLRVDSTHNEAISFFTRLKNEIAFCKECNLNRR